MAKPKKWHPPKAKKVLDKLWSLCVRGRDKRCTFCGRVSGKLDANHIMSRRHLATRWNVGNGNALCFTCHRRFHDDPHWGVVRSQHLIGLEAYERLAIEACAIKPFDQITYECKKVELERFLKELQ